MAILIITATALEMDAALGVGAGRPKAQPQGAVVSRTAHGREVLACVSGIGVINAGLSLGAALTRDDVDGVVCLGLAGSFDLSTHPLCSVRLVDREVWPEYGLLATGWCSADATALGFVLGHVPRADSEAVPDAAVWDRVVWDASITLARLGLCLGPWTTTKSLTVSGVTADAERADLLRARHQAGLENMEGFALAYGCAMANVPFVELRAVSNAVGARPPESWDLPGALVSLGQAAQRLLQTGPGA
ncbi:MAG: futalosine hydrolase [Deltaproteobacteria bacterium HGW-Deltaproteobacteria-8]|jgi:futalosine hydrolase|nr:MAG: futalosine hydrolase [Deltaproteobacteria bacterium HGW-Deltaproteobacteria-8]